MNSTNHPYLVQHFLENSAKRLPDKVALICGDQRLTYQQINNFSNQLAGRLIEMGVQRRDRVAIFLDSSVEAVIAMFGILKAGAVFIMLSPTMKAKKLTYILQDSGARALITHKAKARIVTDAIQDAPELKDLIWRSREDSNSAFQPVTPNLQLPTHNSQSTTSNPQPPTDHSWSEIFSKPSALSPLPIVALTEIWQRSYTPPAPQETRKG